MKKITKYLFDDYQMVINLEEEIRKSPFLEFSQINYQLLPIKKRNVLIKRIDGLIKKSLLLGNIRIKIDTEFFELNVIRRVKNILKFINFLLAEVRHSCASFKGQYKIHKLMFVMRNNGFIHTNKITSRHLIADLFFQTT